MAFHFPFHFVQTLRLLSEIEVNQPAMLTDVGVMMGLKKVLENPQLPTTTKQLAAQVFRNIQPKPKPQPQKPDPDLTAYVQFGLGPFVVMDLRIESVVLLETVVRQKLHGGQSALCCTQWRGEMPSMIDPVLHSSITEKKANARKFVTGMPAEN